MTLVDETLVARARAHAALHEKIPMGSFVRLWAGTQSVATVHVPDAARGAFVLHSPHLHDALLHECFVQGVDWSRAAVGVQWRVADYRVETLQRTLAQCVADIATLRCTVDALTSRVAELERYDTEMESAILDGDDTTEMNENSV
jgi:hypothetical protein